MNYLESFKKKCGVDDKFCQRIENLIDKLIDFGYVSKSGSKELYKRLNDNVNTVIIGKHDNLDFKSGYFDAIRKELYIKDIDNVESFYLRILYVLTTTKVSNENYNVGYSVAKLSKDSYKIEYTNFSVNRAVISNLVCRLLYTVPTVLSIAPTYRTYENTFLGNKISADNDIYFLEGKLLKQLCFILNSNEEDLYTNLFKPNPQKFLEKFLKKGKFRNYDETLELLDKISRLNSNYNKLCFLNKLLNDNYINIKKNILDDKKVKKYKQEEAKIKMAIKSALIKLEEKGDDDEEESIIDIDGSLAEKITNFENEILELTYKFQSMLVRILINTKHIYNEINYGVKLKKLQNILVTENEELNKELHELIRNDLLNTYDSSTSNLIEKIKYSLVNHTLSEEKFVKSYKDLSFRKVNYEKIEANSSLVAFELEHTFIQFILISNINFDIKTISNNTKDLKLTNLGYLFNNSTNNVGSERIEKLYAALKETLKGKSNLLKISDIYISDFDDNSIAIIPFENTYKIFELQNVYEKDKKIIVKELELSDSYDIFSDPNKMPTLYASNKKNIVKRVLDLLMITFWC